MGPAPRRALWLSAKRRLDAEHPLTRARFGRYVATQHGTVTVMSAGPEAWVGNKRELGHAGFRNRAWRKHMERSVTPQ